MSVFADVVIDAQSLIIWLVVGLIAGWLAGVVMDGGGFGILGDIVVGLVGAVLGGFLFGQFGVSLGGGLLGTILVAFIGACLLIAVVRLIRRYRRWRLRPAAGFRGAGSRAEAPPGSLAARLGRASAAIPPAARQVRKFEGHAAALYDGCHRQQHGSEVDVIGRRP